MLAEQIGVPHFVLRNWFQNKRARKKKNEEEQRRIAEAAATRKYVNVIWIFIYLVFYDL